jgi:membrane protein DedA with SNARE-associated domain
MLLYLIIGGLLFLICGSLIWVGYLCSWGFFGFETKDYLKLLIHPVTLLFVFSIWLIYKGLVLWDRRYD